MDDRPRSPRLGRLALLAAVVVGAVGLGVSRWAEPVAEAPRVADPPEAVLEDAVPSPATPGSTYALMQMNLCLSGAAGCYEEAAYPAVVGEAVARIRASAPDAVTINEACRRDAVQIARRTGYHLRFARVIYAGAPFPCLDPGDRGLFGDAVLTKAVISGARSEAFVAQAELEERRWLCVTTRRGMDVCTAHLEAPRTAATAAANDAQCAELTSVLAGRASDLTVFGGDVNRPGSCAPAGAWTRTDSSADQAPGLQHVYGTALRRPVATVLPSRFTDHDVLVVRASGPPRWQ